MANIEAVSFLPYTVNTPPLKVIMASATETEVLQETKQTNFFIYMSQKLKRQTIVDEIDNPRRHESPHHLGEGIGHEPRPGHLPQNTETQGHRWVQMGTCRDVGYIFREGYRKVKVKDEGN